MNLHNGEPYGNLLRVGNTSTNGFFEAIFFDMDGLLVNSEPIWLASETQVTAPYSYEWSEADQVACLGGPLIKVGHYMFERCGNVESPEFFTNKLIEVQSSNLRSAVPLMPGAIELVKELQSHGVATALVSASPRVIVDAVLENLGGNPFPFSISSNDVINTKPHPDAYLLAAKRCGVDISSSLVFEDSLTGVQAGRASGAWVIAVPHLVVIEESARVRSIKSLEQLSFSKLERLYLEFNVAI